MQKQRQIIVIHRHLKIITAKTNIKFIWSDLAPCLIFNSNAQAKVKFHAQGIVSRFTPQQNIVWPCSMFLKFLTAHYSHLENRSISLISNSTATMILQILKFHVQQSTCTSAKHIRLHLVLPCSKSLKIGSCTCDRLFFYLKSIDLSDFQVVRGWSMSKRSWTSARLFSSLKSHTLQIYTLE